MKKLFLLVFIGALGFIGANTHAQVMSFEEFKLLLEKENITLTSEQEALFKKNFEKAHNKHTKKEVEMKSIDGFKDFSLILKKGVHSEKEQIKKLQSLLKKEGYTISSIDGYYGPETMRAIESLKKDLNIHNTAYGIFDPRDFDNKQKSLRKMELFLGSDEIFFYKINKDYIDQKTDIICNNREMSSFEKDGFIIFPITFPYGDIQKISCATEKNNRKVNFLDIYKKENKKVTSYANITVSKKYSTPNAANDARVAREKSMLKALYKVAESKDQPLFNQSFELPLHTQMNSPFGKTRIMNGTVSSFHTGTDFKAITPLPIKSVNDGKVLYTGDLFYCGGTVIINHGLDIFSIYCHLSEIEVQAGQTIAQGDIIGKTGATGRVSGPHLHLSMKFENKYMDFMRVHEYSQNLN